MMSRMLSAGRSISVGPLVVAGLVCVAAALALGANSALAVEAPQCPIKGGETKQESQLREETEDRRKESNSNSATGHPYSVGLPDCRAYEVVSPLYKQAHDAFPEFSDGGMPVAPDGNTVGFWSEGVFAGAENFLVQGFFSQYLSRRGAKGWITSSTFAPRELLDFPYGMGLNGDSTLDLRSLRLSCGQNPVGGREPAEAAGGLACALREPNGSWVPTPTYRALNGAGGLSSQYGGASSDLSRAFIMTAISPAFLPSANRAYALYEIAGVGSNSPILRLVNVNENTELRSPNEKGFAYIGANEGGGRSLQSRYQAISRSGEAVFFTAVPKAGPEVPTVYARVPCRVTNIHCEYVEEVKEGRVTKEGSSKTPGDAATGRETVAVSNPSETECNKCLAIGERTPQEALFQGASADGSKVFFTTPEKLFKGNPDTTSNLYEYDFNKPEGEKLVLLSPDTEGANVHGVIRSSADGSHVYFVASGKLNSTPNTTVNEQGQEVHEEAEAKAGRSNLYAYGCEKTAGENKCETKFVAPASVSGISAEFGENGGESEDTSRPAQVTPDGRYLIFSSTERVAGDLNQSGEAVYRYDFQTGQLTWVSHGAPGFKKENEGKGAYKGEEESSIVPPLPGAHVGADANVNDWNRAISGCPTKGERSEAEELEFSCPEGSYNGEDIIFVTNEKLQANDENKAPDVYEWHCASPCANPSKGEVHLISDGRNPLGVALREEESKGSEKPLGPEVNDTVGMSASGSDIFFSTHVPLVPQDTDLLRDVYDARIDGGFPAPPAEPPCSGEGCQGEKSKLPSFPEPISSVAHPGGNLPAGNNVLAFKQPSPSPSLAITKARLNGKALLVTVKMSTQGTVRISGDGLKTITKSLQAGTHQVQVALTNRGASLRKHHSKTTVRVSLTVGKQGVAKNTTVRL